MSVRFGRNRANKYYSNKTMCCCGHKHDSAKEAARCNELNLLLRAGEIENLEIQKEYLLIPAAQYSKPMKSERKVVYRADFVYFDKKSETTVIEDCKGVRTKDYILKRKLMKQLYCKDGKFIFVET